MRPCLVFAVLLVACTTPEPQPVAIVGRYASRLSDRDIEKIRHVVATYQRRPLRKIEATARNKVRVETGSDQELSWFPLIKHDGKWLVDETGEFESEHLTNRWSQPLVAVLKG